MTDLFADIRRARTPFLKMLKRSALFLLTMHVPVPNVFKKPLRAVSTMFSTIRLVFKRTLIILYFEPVFRARCERVGDRALLWAVPDIQGDAKIFIGDDLSVFGAVGIASSSRFEQARLVIGNHVQIGHQVTFSVSKEITIGDGTMIARGCHISDSDGHPRRPEARLAGLPPEARDVKPIHIERNAWIGMHCTICKGVTIGEGAIVGARSVVIANVPPFAIALGNPAKVLYIHGSEEESRPS